MLSLYCNMHIEVKVNGDWIPFSIFLNGKHGDMLKTWIETMEHDNGMDNDETHAMILAEQLGTSIRFVDSHHGISYVVEFMRGKITQIATYSLNTGFQIKLFAKGGYIEHDFVGELEHIIDV